ncbi:T9SS type A sorting domain-containing protein [candidate division TA06 bacterium]|nr:T9SS type A sorting domain-containing protein [candidate division TA06 bacterium]
MGKKLLIFLALLGFFSPSSLWGRDFQGAKREPVSLGQVKTKCRTHRVGNLWLTITNWGFFGAGNGVYCSGAPNAEFPAGSNMEYLFGAGLWIGAIVAGDTIVATGVEGWTVADETGSDFYELFPGDADEDTIWKASIRDVGVPNQKGVDDDGDWDSLFHDIGYQWVGPAYPQDWNDCGRDGICPGDAFYPGPDLDGSEGDGIWQPGEGTRGNQLPDLGEPNVDEEIYNGKDDDGDGMIDEDYGAISEEDFLTLYSDTVGFPYAPNHTPIGVEVRQSSYAWSYSCVEDFVILDFWIKNIGGQPLSELYVGLYIDADVGPNVGVRHEDDISGFVEWVPGGPGGDSTLVNIAWTADDDGCEGADGVSGVRLLYAGGRDVTEPGLISFNWWVSNGDCDNDFGPWNPNNPNDQKLLEIQRMQCPTDDDPGTPIDDVSKYLLMSNGEFDPDQEEVPPPNPLTPPFGADTRYLYSFGPVENSPGQGLPIGDSVRVVLAYIAAEGFHEGGCDPVPGPPHNFNDFALNSFWAQAMFDNPGWSTARQAVAPTDTASNWFQAYQAKFASLRGGNFLLGDSLPDFTLPDSLVLPCPPVGIAETPPSIPPKTTTLYPATPNPFHHSTRIDYQLVHPGEVSLRIYDLTGRLIQTLVDGEQEGGRYSVRWDGSDQAGQRVPSGVYFYLLKRGNDKLTRKMILLR